jgi:hypothetical protein
MIRYPPIWGVIRRTSPTHRAAAAEGVRQAAYDFLRRHRRWAELRNRVARNGRQPGSRPQMAFARPSSSNKRRFHVEVDHHGLGVLPRAITIQMPKPPQARHQIPSLQLRRDHKREFGTSRDSSSAPRTCQLLRVRPHQQRPSVRVRKVHYSVRKRYRVGRASARSIAR